MPFETFLIIAQIAVALTGFIGITVTLRHGRDAGFSRLLLASILQTTLGAALFAVVPDFLSHLLTPAVMWRVACGSFGLYHLTIFARHIFRQHSLKQMSAVQRVVTVASVPIIGLKLSVGFGVLVAYAYSIYYLGLVWLLGIACYSFALILFHDEHAHASARGERRA
jgi:hypothetical protein